MHGAAMAFIALAILMIAVGVFSGFPNNLAFYAAANGLCVVADLLDRAWITAAISAALTVLILLLWLSRRRRKRAPKLIGAKARALIAAMVAKVRESAKPRPVLRPMPGGARLWVRREPATSTRTVKTRPGSPGTRTMTRT